MKWEATLIFLFLSVEACFSFISSRTLPRGRNVRFDRLLHSEPGGKNAQDTGRDDFILKILEEVAAEAEPGRPSDLQGGMDSELQKKLPSEMELRLKFLGFTPLTMTGFALAFVMLLLNNYLGSGWAARLLNLDGAVDVIEFESRNPLGGLNSASGAQMQIMNLNSVENLLRDE